MGHPSGKVGHPSGKAPAEEPQAGRPPRFPRSYNERNGVRQEDSKHDAASVGQPMRSMRAPGQLIALPAHDQDEGITVQNGVKVFTDGIVDRRQP